MTRRRPTITPFPYTTLFRSEEYHLTLKSGCRIEDLRLEKWESLEKAIVMYTSVAARIVALRDRAQQEPDAPATVLLSEDECRSEEHTSELQSLTNLVCRLLL